MQVFRPVSRRPDITVTREATGRFVVREAGAVIATRAHYTAAAVAAVVHASDAPAIAAVES